MGLTNVIKFQIRCNNFSKKYIPFKAARLSAVLPLLSTILGLAPFLINKSVTFFWPKNIDILWNEVRMWKCHSKMLSPHLHELPNEVRFYRKSPQYWRLLHFWWVNRRFSFCLKMMDFSLFENIKANEFYGRHFEASEITVFWSNVQWCSTVIIDKTHTVPV